MLAQRGGPESVDAIARLARMASSGGSGYIDPTDLVQGLLDSCASLQETPKISNSRTRFATSS